MVTGILGKKIGMSQIFSENGNRVPVTILEAGPCVVYGVRSGEKNGYNAIQLGFDSAREKTKKKPQREELKKNGLETKRFVREIRCAETPDVNVGDKVTINVFQKGDYLDIEATSKGKGFQGGMKRCGWSGGKETHGSKTHRVPGSIGASSFPSKVDRGHPGPGHMGCEKVTVQNLEVVEVDKENATLAVKGAVPGANGGYIVIRFAKKKPIAEREEVPEPEEEVVEETSAEEQVVEETVEDQGQGAGGQVQKETPEEAPAGSGAEPETAPAEPEAAPEEPEVAQAEEREDKKEESKESEEAPKEEETKEEK